jgi:choline kinase
VVPKCLIQVHGKSILQSALEHLDRAEVEDVTLVIGHLGAAVRAATGDRIGAMPIRYVENPEYATTGTAYSLWLALRELAGGDDLLVIEGDVLFEEALLQDFLARHAGNATVVERHRAGLSGTYVALDEQGMVVDWLHRSVRAPGAPVEHLFKTVNITRIERAFAAGVVAPLVERCVAAGAAGAPIEHVFRALVTGRPPCIAGFDAAGRRWVEIDDEADFELAETVFADAQR